ncbi:scaffold attachment factor B2 [Octopus bimaculoides]|nr:scaffold attachment factor B2 [Octopus bimaculoides]|eukprot:XP_014784463.1 PREDICTED: scaffold attachment factor B2-like [Octopus bimaculoides]
MKLEKMKLEKEKLLRSRMEKELLEMENRDVEMRYAEMLRLERMKLEKMKLEKEKFRMEKELLEMERHEEEMRSAELLRFEEMRYSAKRPHDRSGFHDRELWDEHKQSRMRTSGDSSRFELPFQDESRYNTDYGRRIKRYDRRDSRALEGGSRYDDRKEREMMRMEMGPFHNTRVRGEGQIDNRSRNDEEFNWMPSELRRDMGPNGELDRRYIGSDRGYDNDQQNTSANDRLGRNSFGGGPDQRSWDSGGVDRKMDNWSHMHGDIGNSGMNRSNGPWLDKPTNKTGRDATGAFVNSSQSGNSGGMGQYFGHGNMFGNSQVHSGLMVSHRGGGGGI